MANFDVPTKFLNSILKSTNNLDGHLIDPIGNSVVFSMLIMCIQEAQDKNPPQKITLIHPSMSSLFSEPNADIDQLIQSQMQLSINSFKAK